MKSVQEALEEILSGFSRGSAEDVALHEAFQRTLAEDVRAANDLPLFDNSAMDGFALRAADLKQVPVRLKVVGDIPAGTNPEFMVGEGESARIMTGAPIPAGADAVVPIEDTDAARDDITLPDRIEIRKSVTAGAYVRPRGEDVRTGEIVLRAGHVVRPQDSGLLASLGVSQVPVVRSPRVAIISTGDELLPPDAPVEPGKIRDSNSYALRAMVQALGAESFYLGVAGDTTDAIREKLLDAVEQGAEVILSSAGVSVGTRDVVKEVLEELGEIGFWRVNMRPGKPLAFGNVRGIPFFGLPGNPVSSLVSFEVFVRPALLKMLGQSVDVPRYEVIMGEDMTGDGRESYIRVMLTRENGKRVAYSTGTQSSGAISSLVKADALLIIPAGVREVKKGDSLTVRSFAGQPIVV